MESDYDRMMADKSFLPYRVGHLTDWMVKKAEVELNETDENRTKALSEFRKLIANDKALNVWTDDAYLLQFLRAKKFDVKRAWELLRSFYRAKRDFPELYPLDGNLEDLRNLGETDSAGIFNYRNKDGSVVLNIRCGNWDPDIYPFKSAFTALAVMCLAAVEDPATQVCGLNFLDDTKDFTWKQLFALTPRYVKLMGKGLRGSAFPIRVKGIHVVNEPYIFSFFIKFLKLFLSEKIKKRIHFHGTDMESLHKYISKEILPPEYGGLNTSFSAREWCRKEFNWFADRFLEMLSKGYS